MTIKTTRRGVIAGGAAAVSLPLWARYTHAQSAAPIKVGFQVHRTGIGAAYGRWYDRTTQAAVAKINEAGGINGRPVEIVAEDDGTDPKRGAEVVEKFATQHGCDIAFGTLFSHVVIGSSPRAGELKLPYFVVSEGHHVASGMLNRYTLQPGITDVKSQVQAMAPYVASENARQEGHHGLPRFRLRPRSSRLLYRRHRGAGRRGPRTHRDPADGDVLHQVLPEDPARDGGALPRDGRPRRPHLRQGVGRVLRPLRALRLFGFIDSLEAVDIASPGLEFLEGSYFWEGNPRYAQKDQTEYDAAYRAAVGVDENGASVSDPKDISTYAHMFGCWETLHIVKAGMEAAGYAGPDDRAKLIEAVEAMTDLPEGFEHPQGAKILNGKTHQVFGHQYISQVNNGRMDLVHTTSIEGTLYPDEVDYTTQSF